MIHVTTDIGKRIKNSFYEEDFIIPKWLLLIKIRGFFQSMSKNARRKISIIFMSSIKFLFNGLFCPSFFGELFALLIEMFEQTKNIHFFSFFRHSSIASFTSFSFVSAVFCHEWPWLRFLAASVLLELIIDLFSRCVVPSSSDFQFSSDWCDRADR